MTRPKRKVLQRFLLKEDLKDSVHGGLYDEDPEDSVHGCLYDADQEKSVHGLYDEDQENSVMVVFMTRTGRILFPEVFMMRNRRTLFLDWRCPCQGTGRLCP